MKEGDLQMAERHWMDRFINIVVLVSLVIVVFLVWTNGKNSGYREGQQSLQPRIVTLTTMRNLTESDNVRLKAKVDNLQIQILQLQKDLVVAKTQ